MPTIVVLTGFVDSDIRYGNANGKKVANFRVNDGSGWTSVAAWEGLADQVPPKGSHLIVHGRLSTRSYDKEGVKTYATEVVASIIEPVGPALPAQNPPTDDSIFTD